MEAHTRAHWAAAAARFRVAAVVGADNTRGWGSWAGSRGSPVQFVSCILWWAMPASGRPSGTCIFSRKSISQRASSRMSEHPVGALGDGHGAVAEGRGVGAGEVPGPFVGVDQLPGRHAAVDDVLAVVAGVVPAAAHVQPVAAVVAAGHVGVALVGGDVQVAGGAGVLAAAGVLGGDRDAAALVVEERQRVVGQLLPGGRADVEGVAGLVVHGEHVVGADTGVGREIDLVDGVSGGRVGAEDGGGAAGHHLVRAVQQAPGQRRTRTADHGRLLGGAGRVGDLVDLDVLAERRADHGVWRSLSR